MTLHVICGPVRAEKSTTVYRLVSRALRSKKTVDVCVPKMDTRSNGQVVTHSGLSLATLGVIPRVVENSREVFEGLSQPLPDLLVIDEGQFFDIDLPLWLERVPEWVYIVVTGLDLTSDGYPFGPMGHLLCIADNPEKLTAICVCGAEATRSACMVKKDGDVLVGGGETYVPMCKKCWREHRHLGC
jgi:thymidine kinase